MKKYKSMLVTAIALATEKHGDQLDESGVPVLAHVLRVMSNLNTTDEELQCIAVLHDIVEDTDVTLEDLKNLGFSNRVCNAVKLLTHKVELDESEQYNKFQHYIDYINKMKFNLDALIVKRSDIRDNSDIRRSVGTTEKYIKRSEKYARAYRLVESFIQEHHAHALKSPTIS